MKTEGTRSSRRTSRAAWPVLGFVLATAGSGCLNRPLEPIDPRTTFTQSFRQTRSGVEKIDLLLMIDNSGSMADKQAILADAVPNLVKGLLNPKCIGADNKPVPNPPASPADDCPGGSVREFQPVFDVHIGIITSSLGSHGTQDCNSSVQNDAGHLISRTDQATPDTLVDTYQGQGFLAWDPKQKLQPVAGEKDLDATSDKLRQMVHGAGQSGCGYEAQLESWYRFLVDPEPYGSISLDKNNNNNVVLSGQDTELLGERANFLRPDSMVAILMLTDENDCSTREEFNYPVVNDSTATMPRARQECATDPDDHCCAPCTNQPADCPVDAMCEANKWLTPAEDPQNLRCWHQKQRFGVDFLYPVERYVKALTQAQIQKRDGTMVDNPLYPPDPTGALNARTPSSGLVYLAGIVGVPWQDIARRRADGTPDLLGGIKPKTKEAVGGFMSFEELSTPDPKNNNKTAWDMILGDPTKGVNPLDPHMIESRTPRTGLPGPSAPSANQDPINGHEWNTDTAKNAGIPLGDLQYACVFQLKDADVRDCSTNLSSCDCAGAGTSGSDNPLCQDETTGTYSPIQKRAKSYPGTRELAVLKGMGEQGIVASVCPAQVDDANAKDYGYQPAIGALIDKLKTRLSGPCLTRPLTPDPADDHVPCVIIEARKNEGSGACCTGAARQDVDPAHQGALDKVRMDTLTAGDDCFCEITQLKGDDLQICQNDPSLVPAHADMTPVDGWCYVDASVGNAALVESCPSGEPYKVRFVGAGNPSSNALAFITCTGGQN
jgi:hypothetical protein